MGSETEPKKGAGGRPSKYDPAFCEQVIAFCSEGYSLTAFAGSIGVARSTLQEWANQHPEFSVACHAGKAAAAFKWEQRAARVGEKGGGPGTAQIVVFQLRNMAPDDFREKVDHSHEGKVEVGADAAFGDFVRALEGAARAKQGGDHGAGEVDREGAA